VKLVNTKLRQVAHFQPWEFEALRLWIVGITISEIAAAVEQELDAIKKLVKSIKAKRLLDQMRDGTAETVRHMQVSLQVLAPRALERMSQQLDSKNELVAHRAAVWILEAAGHTPLRRLEVRHQYDNEDLELLSIEQLRERAMRAITGQPDLKMIETTATRTEEPNENISRQGASNQNGNS